MRFPVNFGKCVRIPFLQNRSGRLLPSIVDFEEVNAAWVLLRIRWLLHLKPVR